MRGFLEHRIEVTATGHLNPYWLGPATAAPRTPHPWCGPPQGLQVRRGAGIVRVWVLGSWSFCFGVVVWSFCLGLSVLGLLPWLCCLGVPVRVWDLRGPNSPLN
jgi:hypothetical protein